MRICRGSIEEEVKMSPRRMAFVSLVGGLMLFVVSPASPENADCRFVPVRDRFACENENWVSSVFESLRERSRTHEVGYVLQRAGCQLARQPIDHQVKECQRQLGNDFACRVTISLVNDVKVLDQHFYPHCIAKYGSHF